MITLANKTFISLVKTFQQLLPHLHRQELVPLSLQKGRTLSQLLRVNLKTRVSLEPKSIEQVYPFKLSKQIFCKAMILKGYVCHACFSKEKVISSNKNYRSPNLLQLFRVDLNTRNKSGDKSMT